MTELTLSVQDVRLDTIHDTVWALLSAGADGTVPALRVPVLATQSENGVDARVVVLRRVDKTSRILECHTDKRSAKSTQIQCNPDMYWVFYDPERKLQLRLRGTGTLCSDLGLVERRWNELNPHTQRAYAQALSPGTRVDHIEGGAPCAHIENPESGRTNFSLVQCVVSEMEWLVLCRSGHQRAVLKINDTGWSSSWVMP